MLDNFPNEIINIIIKNTCVLPSDYIRFRGINKNCYEIISNLENLYNVIDKEIYEKDIKNFCNNLTPISTFQWMFKNGIIFSLEHIKLLIVEDRADFIKLGFFNGKFLKILFNKFYLSSNTGSNLFSIFENLNPLIIAGMHNRVNIIRLLLEKSIAGNPYIKMISSLLDISIKYNYKNLLSYLIIHQYYEIKEEIESKLISIIYRINNCEDILFYLIKNKDVRIESKHLEGIIVKQYNEILNYHLKNVNYNDTFLKTLLRVCINFNNKEIFSYLMEKIDITIDEFTEYLFYKLNAKSFDTYDFYEYIIDNYLKYVSLNSPLIKYSILTKVSENKIVDLLKKGYMFSQNEMVMILNEERYYLLELMCKKSENIFKLQ